MARLAARSHLGRFRIEVVPNGLDLAFFAPEEQEHARHELNLPANVPLFLAVAGNWSNAHKGGELLLPLASGLTALGQARLVVVGRLSAALAQSLQDAGAIVLGRAQDSATLRQFYSACDATLLLSRNENFPYVVSESLACGCPVIARSIGGVPEMLDQDSGILIPVAASHTDFLKACQAILRLPADRTTAIRLAARQRAVQAFDLSHMLNGYENLYRQLAANPKHQGCQGRTRQKAA
jgi:glycosyltransferase involved in cell wall biosynthesis